jgi:anti-sigma regulatory factor (Ser/Thr protein kinase)
MPKVELHISALPINVRTARLVAAALSRRIGLDAVVIDEVKLAVGEACSRAVSLHRTEGVTEPIIVQFRDDYEMLEIAVYDCGPAGALLPTGGEATDDGGADAVAEEAAHLLEAAASSAQEPAYLERAVDVSSLAPRLGLAMIAGLVDDMSVEDRAEPDAPGGTVVTMRWPLVAL